MFRFLKNFFLQDILPRQQEQPSNRAEIAARAQTAPGTEIHYDPHLISRFKGHHRELVEEILRVQKFMHARNYSATAERLRAFKTLLQQHLLEENLLFYTYLSYCLVDDAEGRELMSDMRAEMGEIGRLVTRFIKHYLEFGINDSNVEKFDNDLSNIIAALSDRIGREEASLYSLYMAPSAILHRKSS